MVWHRLAGGLNQPVRNEVTGFQRVKMRYDVHEPYLQYVFHVWTVATHAKKKCAASHVFPV